MVDEQIDLGPEQDGAETCPASILRRHPGAILHLDREAAKLVS